MTQNIASKFDDRNDYSYNSGPQRSRLARACGPRSNPSCFDGQINSLFTVHWSSYRLLDQSDQGFLNGGKIKQHVHGRINQQISWLDKRDQEILIERLCNRFNKIYDSHPLIQRQTSSITSLKLTWNPCLWHQIALINHVIANLSDSQFIVRCQGSDC